MKHIQKLVCLGFILTLLSCTTPDAASLAVNAYPNYPNTSQMYEDDALIRQATENNARVVIYLLIKRGRLYVDDKLAADWPIAAEKGTPGGFFRVRSRSAMTHGSSGIIARRIQERDEYGIERGYRTVEHRRGFDYEAAGNDSIEFVPDSFPYTIRITKSTDLSCATMGDTCLYGVETSTPKFVERKGRAGGVGIPMKIQRKLYRYLPKGTDVYITSGVPDPEGKQQVINSRGRYVRSEWGPPVHWEEF